MDPSPDLTQPQAQRGQNLRQLAASTFVVNVVLSVFNFLAVIIVVRALGPDGRGKIISYQLIPSVLSLIFALGLPHAATYFVALRRGSAGQIVRMASAIAALSGLFGTMISGVLTWFVLEHTPTNDLRCAGIIYSISIFLISILGVCIHPLRSLGQTHIWNFSRLMLDLSMLIVVVLVTTGSESLRLFAAAQLFWLFCLVVPLITLWKRRPFAPVDVEMSPKVLLSFGLPTMLASLPYFLNFRIDQLFIGTITDLKRLGLYATAVTWSSASMPLVNVVSSLALPRLAGDFASKGKAAAKIVRTSILLALLSASLLALSAPFAISRLFGEAFADSWKMAVPLCYLTALLGVITTVEEILRSYEDVRFPARTQFIGLGINVVLLSFLVPFLSSWGAIIASGATYSIVFVAEIIRVQKLLKVDLKSLFPRYTDSRAVLLQLIGRRS